MEENHQTSIEAIYKLIKRKVQVDPKEVIQKLIDSEIGHRGWVKKKEDKYYQVDEVSAGQHSFDEEEEITKKKYDYVMALKSVLTHLEKNKK